MEELPHGCFGSDVSFLLRPFLVLYDFFPSDIIPLLNWPSAMVARLPLLD